MVLLLFPLVIELTIGGVISTMMMMAMRLLFATIIVEGEMTAMTWIGSLLTQAILVGMRSPKELPETKEDETKATTLGRRGRWGEMRTRIEEMFVPPPIVTRLGNRGMSKNEVRMTTRSSGAERSKGTCYNKRMAKSMNLLLITCMLAAILHSKQIAIDNCYTRCLTVSRRDFLPGTIGRCNVQVAGSGGTMKCEVKGTVSWTVEDDQGREHDLVIPDTPMCEALPRRLFSPQHWAQEAEKGSQTSYHRGERPSCTTNAVATILTWGRGNFVKTIRLDKRKNVAVMTTRPGIKK
jgi:hypothetical protein